MGVCGAPRLLRGAGQARGKGGGTWPGSGVAGLTRAFSPVKQTGQRWETPRSQGPFPGGAALGPGLPLPTVGRGCTSASPVSARGVPLSVPGHPLPAGEGLAPGARGALAPNLPLPSAFSQQQSAVPDVPAAFLSRMAQLSPGLAPGSSPSQAVPVPVAGTQPAPLVVPKAERLSPTSACGESGMPRCLPGAWTEPWGTLRVGCCPSCSR